jgi:hypothetical protein
MRGVNEPYYKFIILNLFERVDEVRQWHLHTVVHQDSLAC